jgi:hypothetical protein
MGTDGACGLLFCAAKRSGACPPNMPAGLRARVSRLGGSRSRSLKSESKCGKAFITNRNAVLSTPLLRQSQGTCSACVVAMHMAVGVLAGYPEGGLRLVLWLRYHCFFIFSSHSRKLKIHRGARPQQRASIGGVCVVKQVFSVLYSQNKHGKRAPLFVWRNRRPLGAVDVYLYRPRVDNERVYTTVDYLGAPKNSHKLQCLVRPSY